MERLLICTDLEHTLIPDGSASESADACLWFRRLTALPQVTLAYTTEWNEVLVRDAIHQYHLPLPDFILGDAGSTFYQCHSWNWQRWQTWEEHLSADWACRSWPEVAALLKDFPALKLQEATQQNTHKLSYYISLRSNHVYLMDEIKLRLETQGIHSNLIWHINEAENIGLLDILPAHANKHHAIKFLMAQQGFTTTNTIFAGNNDNDLPIIISAMPAILVANTTAELREEACHMAVMAGTANTLYITQGGFKGMNGNYAAGILEGIQHYYPAAINWLESK